MKNFFTLALCALGVLSMQAQERYLDEVFESVVVTTDVVYATNVSVLPALAGTTSYGAASAYGCLRA